MRTSGFPVPFNPEGRGVSLRPRRTRRRGAGLRAVGVTSIAAPAFCGVLLARFRNAQYTHAAAARARAAFSSARSSHGSRLVGVPRLGGQAVPSLARRVHAKEEAGSKPRHRLKAGTPTKRLFRHRDADDDETETEVLAFCPPAVAGTR